MIDNPIRKLIRFIPIYGFRRTFIKAISRLSVAFPVRYLGCKWFAKKSLARVWFIGSGQHTLTCLAYYAEFYRSTRFVGVIDPDPLALERFRKLYRVDKIFSKINDVKSGDFRQGDFVYVASDHRSHAEYAIALLSKGCVVHIEKPICTNERQLRELIKAVTNGSGRCVVGFNRPFAEATSDLLSYASAQEGPLSCSWTVLGHNLSADHWYRSQGQGSRILGNLSHWIDFAVFVCFSLNRIPHKVRCGLVWGDEVAPSDNIVLSLKTDLGDLYSIHFSSRGEPFEGVRENCIFSRGDMSSVITDFRSQKIELGQRQYKKKYFPKDVGHKGAALQMFDESLHQRSWHEISLSALLILFIERMMCRRSTSEEFDFSSIYEYINKEEDMGDSLW